MSVDKDSAVKPPLGMVGFASEVVQQMPAVNAREDKKPVEEKKEEEPEQEAADEPQEQESVADAEVKAEEVEAEADPEQETADESPATDADAVDAEATKEEEPKAEAKSDRFSKFKKDGKLDEEALGEAIEREMGFVRDVNELFSEDAEARVKFLRKVKAKYGSLPQNMQEQLNNDEQALKATEEKPVVKKEEKKPALTRDEARNQFRDLMSRGKEDEAFDLYDKYLDEKIAPVRSEIEERKAEEVKRKEREAAASEHARGVDRMKNEIAELQKNYPSMFKKDAQGNVVAWTDAALKNEIVSRVSALEQSNGGKFPVGISLTDVAEVILAKRGQLRPKQEKKVVARPQVKEAPRPALNVKKAPPPPPEPGMVPFVSEVVE